jgi:hypothetical protein
LGRIPKYKKQAPIIMEIKWKSTTCHIPLVAPFLAALITKSFFVVCFFILCSKEKTDAVDMTIPARIARNTLSEINLPTNVIINNVNATMLNRLHANNTPGTLYKTDTNIPIEIIINIIPTSIPTIGSLNIHPSDNVRLT